LLARILAVCTECQRLSFPDASSVRCGTTKSCACQHPNDITPKLDEVGKTYGRLTVIERAGHVGTAKKKIAWRCKCDCGNETVVAGNALRTGTTQSCGCFNLERRVVHGLYRSAEYKTLKGMIGRCHQPSAGPYPRYGAKGIRVCDRWRFGEDGLAGVEAFIKDVGLKPSPKHSIDRIDPNGHYEPGNVRWVGWKVESDNKRSSNKIVFKGVEMTISELARNTKLVRKQLYRLIVTEKMSPEEAVREVRRRRRKTAARVRRPTPRRKSTKRTTNRTTEARHAKAA
jgi:hypothetical protein